MLKGLAKSVLVGAVQRNTGARHAGPISTALLTTGISLVLARGRRPMGLALLAAGGLLRWREIEHARAAEQSVGTVPVRRRAAPVGGASPARPPR